MDQENDDEKIPPVCPNLMDGQYDYDTGKHHGRRQGTYDAFGR